MGSHGKFRGLRVYRREAAPVACATYRAFLDAARLQAVRRASWSSARLSFERMAVVAPRLPQALGTGAKASGAIMHLNSCCSGVNMKFAVFSSAARVT